MLGGGAIIYNENQNNVNRLNDEDAKLAARIKALEDTPGYTLPSTISTNIAAACSNLAALDAAFASAPADLAAVGTGISGAITATCS